MKCNQIVTYWAPYVNLSRYFGAEFPNGESVAHKPNEYMTKEQMLKAFRIYKKAIENIVK